MEKRRLEHLSWKAVEFISKNKNRSYHQGDIAGALGINIAEAYEITNFLEKMGVAEYKKHSE
jgi:DNA-binding MarR family transcriptional regulator